jgi:putative ABC transport system ATP-binding protein
MVAPVVVKLENVWKTYHLGEETLNALKDVSIEIRKGDFFAIQGPSGSGKSTAMHIIGALDVPDKGAVYIGGTNVHTLSEDGLAKLRGKMIGFVFQQFNLISTMTALENVMLPMIFQGFGFEERKARATELLGQVGLLERKDHRPNELSGGQQQRVAVARALANDPEIILADEPTGNLDSAMGKKVFELLHELNAKGKTVIFITHDDKLADQAQNAAYIKDGQIVKTRRK